MSLVDSSVWIDYMNGVASRGFDSPADYRRAKRPLASLSYADMLGREVAERSASSYRQLRRRGITVRKTIDALIATFCIVNSHSLLHADRDFDPFARHFGLVVV